MLHLTSPYTVNTKNTIYTNFEKAFSTFALNYSLRHSEKQYLSDAEQYRWIHLVLRRLKDISITEHW